MAGSYYIDAIHGVVFTRGWGAISDAEILAHATTLAADPRFSPGFRQIADFRDVTETRLSSGGVINVASRNPFHKSARRVFIVSSDEAFGMVRMFESYADSDPEQFTIVRTLEQALAWVGAPAETPWPVEPPDWTFGA